MRPGTGVSCASWDLTTVTDSRRPPATRTRSLSSGGTPLVPSSGATLITSSGAGGLPNPPTPLIPPPPPDVHPAAPATSPAHVTTATITVPARRARPCPCLTTGHTTGPTGGKRDLRIYGDGGLPLFWGRGAVSMCGYRRVGATSPRGPAVARQPDPALPKAPRPTQRSEPVSARRPVGRTVGRTT